MPLTIWKIAAPIGKTNSLNCCLGGAPAGVSEGNFCDAMETSNASETLISEGLPQPEEEGKLEGEVKVEQAQPTEPIEDSPNVPPEDIPVSIEGQ